MTLHSVTPALAVASARKWRGLCASTQGGRGQRSSLCAKTDRPLWKEQSGWTSACKSQLHDNRCVCVCALLPKWTVRCVSEQGSSLALWHLLGYWTSPQVWPFCCWAPRIKSTLKLKNPALMWTKWSTSLSRRVTPQTTTGFILEGFKTAEHTSGLCKRGTPHLWIFHVVGHHFTFLVFLFILIMQNRSHNGVS